MVAGPCYLVAGLVQALTRRGFDRAHDDLSLLANGSLGWAAVCVRLYRATPITAR